VRTTGGESDLVELRVMSGCHNGSVERLPYGVYSIGRSDGADVVLADSAISPIQVRVALDAETLRVESFGGEVMLGRTRIEPCAAAVADYPADVLMNGVHLRWSAVNKRPPSRKSAGRAFAGLCAVATLTIAAASVTTGARDGGAPPTGCQLPCTSSIGGPVGGPDWSHPLHAADQAAGLRSDAQLSRPPDSARPPPGRPSLQAATLALQERLSSAGLTAIEVTAGPDAVMAKGMVDPAAVRTWYDAREWFDQTFGTAVVLSSEVETRAAKSVTAPMSVQAIWAGRVPHVIDQRGQTYFEGSLISDGWSIERIEQGRITLRRRAEVFVLRL
jgi:type III secretion protein D